MKKQCHSYWSKNYHERKFRYDGASVAEIDSLVATTLSSEDQRTLNTLIRKLHVYTKLGIESERNTFKDFPSIDKERIARLDEAIKVHSLYDKAGIDEKLRIVHWDMTYNIHLLNHRFYTENTKPERKDNKSYINYGNRDGKAGRIRYPSKKRKTAWKRFYKLFPHLKPEPIEK